MSRIYYGHGDFKATVQSIFLPFPLFMSFDLDVDQEEAPIARLDAICSVLLQWLNKILFLAGFPTKNWTKTQKFNLC